MAFPVCVVTGVGPGNGAAFCRKFASAGFRVAMLARTEARLREYEKRIPGTKGYAVDVGNPEAVRQAYGSIRADLGPVNILIHNAGSGVFTSFMKTGADVFEASWRTNALALLTCGQEAAADMLAAGQGNIAVIGATASLRGGANFTAFAAAKAAQRSLAQSMARSLGPEGIHVSYVIIDGVVDIPYTRSLFPNQPDEFFLRPDEIANNVFHLTRQERSAWTFELDLRPFGERW